MKRTPRRGAGYGGAASVYVGLSLYACSNLLADPLHRLPFYAGDGMLTVWNYWWARWALVVLHQSPLATSYLSYPHEASLLFQAHDLLHGVLSIPLQTLVPGLPGVTLSVNLVTFLCYVVSALAAYAWFHLLVGSRLAALFAGFGYGFSAYHASWAPMPVIAALYWLPLFAVLFVHAVRRDGIGPALWPGLCFALCTLQSLYYTLFLAMLSVPLAVVAGFTERPGRRVRRRLLAIGAGLVLGALPMGVLVARDLAVRDYIVLGSADHHAPKKVDDECRNSIDLAGTIIPGPGQGLWRGLAKPWNEYLRRPTCRSPHFGLNGIGGELTYVGIVPLLLAVLAWRVAPRRVALVWTIGTLFFGGLALGPYLHVYGNIHRQWWLPLPYRLLPLLGPLGNMYHQPAYFWVLALFGIWTLAAFGLGWLLGASRFGWRRPSEQSERSEGGARGQAEERPSRFGWRRPSEQSERSEGGARGHDWKGYRRRRWAWMGGIVGWLAIDYAGPPLPGWPVSLPDVYEQIAADPGPVSVLDLPTGNFLLLEEYNAGQAVHHKPLARGFLARTDVAVRRRDEMIEAAQSSSAGLQALLDELGPTYVVVRKKLLPPPLRQSLLDFLARYGPEAELVSDRDGIVAYRLMPSRPAVRPLPSPITRSGER